MVKPLEHKKRQQTLIGLLAIVLIITAFVWYSNYKKEPYAEELAPSQEEQPGVSIDEQRLKEIKLDFSILDDDLFKSLKSHGALPVTSGETGRKNPFEPY